MMRRESRGDVSILGLCESEWSLNIVGVSPELPENRSTMINQLWSSALARISEIEKRRV
jgi:hypothetical protein